MPIYNIESIVEATHFRKDGSEIISKNGKNMWRVTIHIREFPGKYIVGFTPWEPDERFLGECDLVITTKQWENRTNYCFSLTALMRPKCREMDSVTHLKGLAKVVPTANEELIRKMTEVLERLVSIVDVMQDALGKKDIRASSATMPDAMDSYNCS